MHNVVTSTGNARELITFELIHHRQMHIVFEGPGAGMTVQASRIVEWLIETYRIHRRAQVLHIDVFQPVQLHANGSVHRVIGVARVAGFVGWNSVILEMCGGNVICVIDVETLSPRLHDVA